MKTVFIDRDGVVNKRLVDDWVKCWLDFEFLPGVCQAVGLLKKSGYRCLLVTNQRGVSLELFSLSDLEEIHRKMNTALKESSGGFFDDIFFCPHDRHHKCSCRKPEPGLFFQAVEKYPDIKLAETVMFGDSESDRQASEKAGCGGFYLVTADRSLLDRVKEFLEKQTKN